MLTDHLYHRLYPRSRHSLFHNVCFLFGVLLTYMMSSYLAHKTSLPLPHANAVIQVRQGGGHWMDQEIDETSQSQQLWKFPNVGTLSLEPSPGVVWLMSFGGSGTSYTITNVETSTGTTTATNYAEDFDECVGILPVGNDKRSPCLHKPKTLMPASYILTKTHCGGYCMDCAPNLYVHTKESFELACRTARLKRNTTVEEFVYDTKLVERAVHMIRNPFDNLVGRMHLGRKRRKQQGRSIDLLEDTPAGLAAWCREIDEHALERERNSPLLPNHFVEKYGHVPCHTEWFRLAQWHTRTEEVTKHLKLPVHYLYYENYTTNFDQTTRELFDFLQLDAVNPPYPFYPGKSYTHLFDRNHSMAAAQLVQDVASRQAWNLLKHYFDLQNDVGTTSSVAQSHDFPSIALLMSFPNSGTSYTMSNTERVSQQTTASNYGIGLYKHERLPNGPFLHREQMKLPSTYMLTKTHCRSYCDNCHPATFVIPSKESFLEGCLTSEQMVDDTPTKFTYNASLVTRVVHLFRSPFDNLVARMHLAVKRRRDDLGWSEDRLARFSHSRDGYLSWCKYIRTNHGDAFFNGSYVSDGIVSLMEDLPCSMDWYRWTQWHNYAIEVTKAQNLPVHYLYYESYSAAYNKTLHDLFAFLELPLVEEPLPFHAGKTYRDLHSDGEIQKATRLVRALASPDCWDLIKHYFEL